MWAAKDVFETVSAGPYKLYVTVRMPTVIPGVAAIEVRSSVAAVSGIHITPLPITGEASDASSDIGPDDAIDHRPGFHHR